MSDNTLKDIHSESLPKGPKLLKKRIQVYLDVKGEHLQHRL
jgi:hypothetical protein